MTRLTAALLGLLGLLATVAAASVSAAPNITSQRVQDRGELRVCIWPDYYGISLRNPRTGQLSGIDIDLSAAFAADLKVKPVYVDSSFATLVDDLLRDRCDVAMFAIGMTPQRAQALRFSRPYLESDIYAVTTRSSRVVQRWQDLDRPGVRIAVQAGTFMEPVMAAALKQANLVVVRPPATRERELEAGRVDAFMTDYPYSRRLLDNADWARLVAPPAPFSVLPYAYAVKPGDAAWLTAVDEFVSRIQRDGRLQAAAKRHGLSAIVRER
ncbi:amino acid ABC transporter substrate-binding protein [Pelomonas sp. Root1217]|uniref:ABC transporter substrate-binding protein n=1 Tax=Pelomonas sp. Root1217 TaxID=1736430 RepID=UPI000709108C|nr:ABC transporter substrate-binding protein [Pelomonas sp. Root1217]KQV50241.1 amino acid ABC transporter substrate-binding protein [Pelomonas sp. Root1217]